MFEPYLSGRPFGLAFGTSHRNLAQAWVAGQAVEHSDFGSFWTSETQVNVGDCDWYASSNALALKARSAIIKVGIFNNQEIFFFVSPFRSIAAAFQAAAPGRLATHVPDRIATDFMVNLNALTRDEQISPSITAIDFVSSHGNRVSASPYNGQILEQVEIVNSVSLTIQETCVKINNRMELEINALDTPVRQLAANLGAVFSTISPHSRLDR